MSDTREAAYQKLLGELPDFKRSLPEIPHAFMAGWGAALASVPPVPDNTELIAEAKKMLGDWEYRGSRLDRADMIGRLVAALESLSATTQQEKR